MLISDERKLVFIHIQKTGGETISDLLRGRIPGLRSTRPKHQRACDALAETAILREYFVFAFVRNPWDRLVSWYSMISEARHLERAEAKSDWRKLAHFRQVRRNPLWRYALEHSTDFPSFVRNCTHPVEMGPGIHSAFGFNQLDYITDPSGRVIADFVGRFERFHEDVAEVFRVIALGDITTLPHENPSRHPHYTTFYDEETAEIVRRQFARDIDHFGYSFD